MKAIADRIAEFHSARFAALMRKAERLAITFENDPVVPGQLIAREEGVEGRCELVSEKRCTCAYFQWWNRCAHHTLGLAVLRQKDAEQREAA